MSHRFGRAARLRSRVEFTAVQSGGRRAPGKFLTLLGRPNSLGRDRLGIIASKRVGGAVARNRAKRRVRELFRRDTSRPAGAADLDLVVIVRSELVDAPFDAIAADFRAALKKLRGGRDRKTIEVPT
ncbi:MAG TPA: ribonuclease P protein component [Vicinamibacterales bacterium]|nr:ribonuclease P protein component [Vicinamibacterales bacterium]